MKEKACTLLTRRPPRLWVTKIKGLLPALLSLRLMVSESRRLMANSRICGGGSFNTRVLYSNVIIRAAGKSVGNKSLGQHNLEVAQVPVA